MAGRKYKYLPHTADVAFVAYGNDMTEALENAVLALLEHDARPRKRIAKRDAPSGSVRIRETASNPAH